MAGAVLEHNSYTFTKYLIQLSVFYEQNALALMLIQSSSASMFGSQVYIDEEHNFMMKSILLCGKFDLAYLYVLKHHSSDLCGNFFKFAQINGNLAELAHFKQENKLLEYDQEQLMLDLSPGKKENFEALLLKL